MNKKTPLLIKFATLVGYLMAFVCLGAAVWSLGFEKTVWLVEQPSIVWVFGTFAGLYITVLAENKRLKLLLRNDYPKFPDHNKLLIIGMVMAAGVLTLILK